MFQRILLADDHPVVRIGVRAIIEVHALGQVVAETGTVDELFQLLSEQSFDLLVTDLSMPGTQHIDVYAMIERICRNHPELPVLVLSMTSNASVLRTVYASGVLGLLDKASSMSAAVPGMRMMPDWGKQTIWISTTDAYFFLAARTPSRFDSP